MKQQDEIRGLLYAYRELAEFEPVKEYKDENGNVGLSANLNPSREVYRLAIIDLETKVTHKTSITTGSCMTDMLWQHGSLWVACNGGVYHPSSGKKIDKPARQLITLEGKLYAHNNAEFFEVDTGNTIVSEDECKSAGILNIIAIVPYKKGLLALATTPYKKHGGDYNTLEYFSIRKTKNGWEIQHLAQHPGSGKRDFPFWHDVGPQHMPLMINVNDYILSTSGWCGGSIYVQKDVTEESITKVHAKDCPGFLAYDRTRRKLFVQAESTWVDRDYYIHDVTQKKKQISIDVNPERLHDLFDYNKSKAAVSFLYITKSQMDELLAKHAQGPVQKTLW